MKKIILLTNLYNYYSYTVVSCLNIRMFSLRVSTLAVYGILLSNLIRINVYIKNEFVSKIKIKNSKKLVALVFYINYVDRNLINEVFYFIFYLSVIIRECNMSCSSNSYKPLVCPYFFSLQVLSIKFSISILDLEFNSFIMLHICILSH